MNFKVDKALSFKSFVANNSCFSFTLKFIFEETKLIKKEGVSIFLMANEASEGMAGLFLIIFKLNSFIASTIALNSALPSAGLASTTGLTCAIR